jgi:hypothetical protein
VPACSARHEKPELSTNFATEPVLQANSQTVRVRELRERLGIADFDPTAQHLETISLDKAATRLGICVGSVYKLIRTGVLPATQLMQSATWQIPTSALEAEAVKLGVREIIERRPKYYPPQAPRLLSRRMHYVTRFPRLPRNT